MNWEAIGAVGEVLGAIAVIATLAYLAVQIRQNTLQLHQSTEVARYAAIDQVGQRGYTLRLSLADPKHSAIYLKGLAGADLDQVEALQFNMLLQNTFFALQDTHERLVGSDLMPEIWTTFPTETIQQLGGSPGVARLWPTLRRGLLPRFIAEAVLDPAPADSGTGCLLSRCRIRVDGQ